MAKRKEIFNRTNGRCFYCGCYLDFDDFHVDHYIPKALGGKGGGNLVPSCVDCNLSKAELTVEEWRKKLEQILDSTAAARMIKKFYNLKPKKIKFFFEGCDGKR